jgi:acyl-coenzyme A thioesterase PaaI-like protein
MKFVTGGLLYGGTSGPTYRPKRLTVGESNVPTRVEGRRVIAVGNSGAALELRVQDGDCDPTGALRYGVLLDLASSAAELAAGGERPPAPALLNLAVSLLASTRARRLVATARCQQRGDAVLHVGVSIHEDRSDGAAVMTGQATFVASRQGEAQIKPDR